MAIKEEFGIVLRMQEIRVRDRQSREIFVEQVYGELALDLLYERQTLKFLLPFIAKVPFLSRVYGLLQKSRYSARKIAPFIERYGIEMGDFIGEMDSFNSFFTRKLAKGVRPLADTPAILPADGRYRIFEEAGDFVVKGKQFDLETFLGRPHPGGSIVIARLAPVDYHRFHFPVDGTIVARHVINGPLYSVNPVAIAQNIRHLSDNKRIVTEIATEAFGVVSMVEVGATYVGSIVETHRGDQALRGAEKGYFEFGGSCIVLVFERGTIEFDEDLIDSVEVLGQMGQRLGVSR